MRKKIKVEVPEFMNPPEKPFDGTTCNDCKYSDCEWSDEPCDSCTIGELNFEPRDEIKSPKHYNRLGAMECLDEMILFFGEEEVKIFCKLNTFKYRYRAAEKNGEEDLKKSDFYAKFYRFLEGNGVDPRI